PPADARSIRIRLLLDPEAGVVLGDPQRLQQVVWNLLSNAIKFSPAGGRVEVRLEADGSHVELEVSDAGQGIPAEFLPHLFERFRQADSSTTRAHGGLGVGLAIVHHLIERHGGTVRAESPGPGQGATFTVRLPATARRSDPSAVEPARCPPAGDYPNLRGVRVLIVDDDRDTGEVLESLVIACGAEATTASSTAEALAVLARRRVDVLVSDIGMPGDDGYALIQRIREGERQRESGLLPAIALTAYARPEDREQALVSGFQAHVAKPVEPAERLAGSAATGVAAQLQEFKLSYGREDAARWARKLGVPWNPHAAAVDTTDAAAGCYVAAAAGKERGYRNAVFSARWSEGRDIGDRQVLADCAAKAGLSPQAFLDALAARRYHDEVPKALQLCLEDRIFGVPIFVVDGKRFWGNDRIEFLLDQLRGAAA